MPTSERIRVATGLGFALQVGVLALLAAAEPGRAALAALAAGLVALRLAGPLLQRWPEPIAMLAGMAAVRIPTAFRGRQRGGILTSLRG